MHRSARMLHDGHMVRSGIQFSFGVARVGNRRQLLLRKMGQSFRRDRLSAILCLPDTAGMPLSAKSRIAANESAPARLRRFLACHPDAQALFTISDLARELDVSRQRVFVLLPNWKQSQEKLEIQRVRAFARRHPKARLGDPEKRLIWAKISAEARVPVPTLKRIWRMLNLPNEDSCDPQLILRRRAAKAQRRSRAVLKQTTCVYCGKAFPWTWEHERSRRYYGRQITCSRSCGQRLRVARLRTGHIQ